MALRFEDMNIISHGRTPRVYSAFATDPRTGTSTGLFAPGTGADPDFFIRSMQPRQHTFRGEMGSFDNTQFTGAFANPKQLRLSNLKSMPVYERKQLEAQAQAQQTAQARAQAKADSEAGFERRLGLVQAGQQKLAKIKGEQELAKEGLKVESKETIAGMNLEGKTQMLKDKYGFEAKQMTAKQVNDLAKIEAQATADIAKTGITFENALKLQEDRYEKEGNLQSALNASKMRMALMEKTTQEITNVNTGDKQTITTSKMPEGAVAPVDPVADGGANYQAAVKSFANKEGFKALPPDMKEEVMDTLRSQLSQP
jgi:hypothetical protein